MKSTADKIGIYRVRFQTEYWPAVATAQGWNPKDEAKRRELRAHCWQAIGCLEKGDGMPIADAEATALFTLCRHLSDPNNLTKLREWEKCCEDFRAYNIAKNADYWERRGFGSRGSRKIRENRFGGRQTAQGEALDDPLSRKDASQRLWKMRQVTRSKEKKVQPVDEPEDDLIPF